jgi:hypothetical protein
VNSTLTREIQDSRDWALGLLLRQQRLRLRLCAARSTARAPAPEVRARVALRARSLPALAAEAERLCARGALAPQP